MMAWFLSLPRSCKADFIEVFAENRFELCQTPRAYCSQKKKPFVNFWPKWNWKKHPAQKLGERQKWRSQDHGQGQGWILQPRLCHSWLWPNCFWFIGRSFDGRYWRSRNALSCRWFFDYRRFNGTQGSAFVWRTKRPLVFCMP